jgi:hypothetical protein
VLEPVQLVVERACHFKAKPCGRCGKPKSNAVHRKAENGGTCEFQRKTLCANCGLAKSDRRHLGAPPAFHKLGSGDRRAYQAVKQQWQDVLTELLEESGLQRGLGRVMVEGEATFPEQLRRDQGNYRILIEKALGDTLVAGGWLEDDDWARYEFGNLAYRYEHGVSRTRLYLFPAPAEVVPNVRDELTLPLPLG